MHRNGLSTELHTLLAHRPNLLAKGLSEPALQAHRLTMMNAGP